MKKVYVKPKLELESFEMSANIAGSCVVFMTKEQVEIDKAWGVFTQDESEGCIDKRYSCYHVPSGGLVVFTS